MLNSSALTRRTTPTPHFPGDDPFYRAVGRFFGDWAGNNAATSTTGWMPAIDIRESEEAFTVVAELAGMTKKDVEVTLENNVLTLRGSRAFENDENQENYHRVERAYGSFQRSFTLPNGIDAEKVAATFKDGLLTLVVPKAATARARTIKVS